MSIIIGIDPGLNKTGWGVIKSNKNEIVCVDYGVIATDNNNFLEKKLLIIHSGITNCCNKYQPQEAAIEETFVNKNPKSSLLLGVVRGALLLTFALLKINVKQYPTNLIKEAISGNGHADKQQVMLMVKCILNLTKQIESLDASDALAVAIYHNTKENNFLCY